MLDVFAFSNKDNPDDSKSAFGIRQQEDSGNIFLTVEGDDSPCIAETLTARWQGFDGVPTAEMLADLMESSCASASAAAFALNGTSAAWSCTGGARLFRFHDNRAVPATDAGGTEVTTGDAFLLCTASALEYLHEDVMLVDLIKASTAREWAESLLVRIMEALPKAPGGLSLLAVRIVPEA